VGLLLGTDTPHRLQSPMHAGFSVHRELALLVAAGLSPYQALETGTRNPALFLGALDSTGAVAVGKRADLVLLDGNPLQDLRYTAVPAGVMAGGRWFPRVEVDSALHAMMRDDHPVVIEPGDSPSFLTRGLFDKDAFKQVLGKSLRDIRDLLAVP
jgi:adenine deaminase